MTKTRWLGADGVERDFETWYLMPFVIWDGREFISYIPPVDKKLCRFLKLKIDGRMCDWHMFVDSDRATHYGVFPSCGTEANDI